MNRLDAYGLGVSVAARLPGPLLPVGVLAAAAASTGSMFTTATLVAAALVGMSISAPAAAALAERVGPRNVQLVSAIVHVLMLVLMVTSIERLTRQDTITSNAVIYVLLLLFTVLAGLSTPATATFSRARRWTREPGPATPSRSVRSGLRAEAALDDGVLVAAPLLVAALSFGFGPTAGLLCSAVLTAVAVPLYAVAHADPTPAPAEATRSALGGVEHAQQVLLEHRGLAPDRPPGEAAFPDAFELPAAEGAASTGGVRGMAAGILLAAGLGAVLGGLWITVLDSAQALARPSLFTLTFGLIAAAAVLAARARSQAFPSPLLLRRRRLHAAALLTLSVMLLATVALPSGLTGFLLLSTHSVLTAAVLGRLSIGLYAGMAVAVSADRLPIALSAASGGVLLGLALGVTLAGIAAEELGLGFSALVCVAGGLLAAVVVLGGQLWGSPRASGARPARTPFG
ncbi:hypothetical protein [Nesterenkonia lutea]|uniref:MFS transporter n=1 Tax=Nesterenkonia lutea TaxID=272919 RepID=A0ABR9JCL5_9MICC|nr:hypothetical protein [Nesterenkonia lutea]MBE1523668.1 hypothetical protein [Nesterenkonia lutea]